MTKNKLTSKEIRKRFFNFMEEKKHKIIKSAPLMPQNDPTTLFTGSGMQPMLPYLLGQPHPDGTRIADIQKCFRANEFEEVGDNRHTTAFEMVGNWSFGDYFKEEQIK
jgi:alanyl-tRNA synthetase